MKKALAFLLIILSLCMFSACGNTTFEEGTYHVGEDIPAGEYVVYSKYSDDEHLAMVWAYSDEDMTDDIGTAYNSYNMIITISDGQYLKLLNCEAVPSEEVEQISTSTPGTFRVGIDIEEGTYTLIKNDNSENGQYTIYSNSDIEGRNRSTFDGLVPKMSDGLIDDEGTFDESVTITVSSGQYLELSDCTIQY